MAIDAHVTHVNRAVESMARRPPSTSENHGFYRLLTQERADIAGEKPKSQAWRRRLRPVQSSRGLESASAPSLLLLVLRLFACGRPAPGALWPQTTVYRAQSLLLASHRRTPNLAVEFDRLIR